MRFAQFLMLAFFSFPVLADSPICADIIGHIALFALDPHPDIEGNVVLKLMSDLRREMMLADRNDPRLRDLNKAMVEILKGTRSLSPDGYCAISPDSSASWLEHSIPRYLPEDDRRFRLHISIRECNAYAVPSEAVMHAHAYEVLGTELRQHLPSLKRVEISFGTPSKNAPPVPMTLTPPNLTQFPKLHFSGTSSLSRWVHHYGFLTPRLPFGDQEIGFAEDTFIVAERLGVLRTMTARSLTELALVSPSREGLEQLKENVSVCSSLRRLSLKLHSFPTEDYVLEWLASAPLNSLSALAIRGHFSRELLPKVVQHPRFSQLQELEVSQRTAESKPFLESVLARLEEGPRLKLRRIRFIDSNTPSRLEESQVEDLRQRGVEIDVRVR